MSEYLYYLWVENIFFLDNRKLMIYEWYMIMNCVQLVWKFLRNQSKCENEIVENPIV